MMEVKIISLEQLHFSRDISMWGAVHTLMHLVKCTYILLRKCTVQKSSLELVSSGLEVDIAEGGFF